MRFSRDRDVTLYCRDVTCPGATGFTTREVGATDIDPAWLVDDCCPYCRDGDIAGEQVEWENPMACLSEGLEEANALTKGERDLIDWRTMFGAVYVELERQRIKRAAAEAEAKRAAYRATRAPERRASINAAFPADEALPF